MLNPDETTGPYLTILNMTSRNSIVMFNRTDCPVLTAAVRLSIGGAAEKHMSLHAAVSDLQIMNGTFCLFNIVQHALFFVSTYSM